MALNFGNIFSRQVMCPYCLEPIQEKDITLTCNRNGHPKPPKSPRSVTKCDVAGCLGIYNTRSCPACGAELPADIFDYKKYIRFSIVGTTGAGKTCFITSMLEEFRNAGLQLVPSPINDDTNRYFSANRDAIFKHFVIPPPTRSGAIIPMQWRILDKNKMKQHYVPPYSLTIFDGAGEDQQRMDDTISRYISGSKTIMFLIDPMLLSSVRASLTADDIQRSSTTSAANMGADELVNRMASYIRETLILKTGTRIDKPLAVIFPKIDALRPLFPGSRIFDPSEHLTRKAFIESESMAVHHDVSGWLRNAGEGALIDALDVNFTAWRFFAVSAFGNPSTGSGKLMPPSPMRILDPLMWVLAQEGIVASQR